MSTSAATKTSITLRARNLVDAGKPSAAYTAHLRKVTTRISQFRAVVNGEQRLDFIADVFLRLSLISPEVFQLPIAAGAAPPSEFLATTIRCSKGIALLHWRDHDALLVMEGSPSLAIGSTVRVTYRGDVDTQKVLAAKKAGAGWIHPTVYADVWVSGQNTQPLPTLHASILNAAYFTIETQKEIVDGL